MNIQNIAALSGQLQSLGFENVGYPLLKRICFKPRNFHLLQKIQKGKDRLSFQFFFEVDNEQNAYFLKYYDASLQKEIVLADTTINGINSNLLEKQMADVDWKRAFQFEEKKLLDVDDKVSWEKEQKIESIVKDLAVLDSTEDGKIISLNLKHKFWAGVSDFELLGNISPLKNKPEVSQRFYFFEGQAGISLEEAYRFLQNQFLEKQILAAKKQVEEPNVSELKDNGAAATGGSLLAKKRATKSKAAKNNKATHH